MIIHKMQEHLRLEVDEYAKIIEKMKEDEALLGNN